MTTAELSVAIDNAWQRYAKTGKMDEGRRRHLLARIAQVALDDLVSSEAYKELARSVRASYTYGRAYELEGFDAGMLWGVVTIFDAKQESIREQLNNQLLLTLAGQYRDQLAAIKLRPGITHGELAKTVSSGKSNLSHIMRKLIDARLVISKKEGRRKHYYLTPAALRIDKLRTLKDGIEDAYAKTSALGWKSIRDCLSAGEHPPFQNELDARISKAWIIESDSFEMRNASSFGRRLLWPA